MASAAGGAGSGNGVPVAPAAGYGYWPSASAASPPGARLSNEDVRRYAREAAAAIPPTLRYKVEKEADWVALPFEKEGGIANAAIDILVNALASDTTRNPRQSPLRDVTTFLGPDCLGETPIVMLAITHAEHTGVQSPFNFSKLPVNKGLLGFSRFYDSRESLGAFLMMGNDEYDYVRDTFTDLPTCRDHLTEIFRDSQTTPHSITFRNEPFYVRKLTISENEKHPLLRKIMGIYEIDFATKQLSRLTGYYGSELERREGLTEDELLKSFHDRLIHLHKARPGFALIAGCNVITDRIPGEAIAHMLQSYSGPQGVVTPEFRGANRRVVPFASSFKENINIFSQKKQADVLYFSQIDAIKHEFEKTIGVDLDIAFRFMTKNLDPRDIGNIVYRYTKLKYIQRALYAGVSYTTILQLLASTFGLGYDLPSVLVNYKSWSTTKGKESNRAAEGIAAFSKAAGFAKEYEVADHSNGKDTPKAADVDLSKWRIVQAAIMPESKRTTLNERDFLLESLSNDSMVDFTAIVSARFYEGVRRNSVPLSASVSAAGAGAGPASAAAAPAAAAGAAAPATAEVSDVLYVPPSGPLPVPDISTLHRRPFVGPRWQDRTLASESDVTGAVLLSAETYEAARAARAARDARAAREAARGTERSSVSKYGSQFNSGKPYSGRGGARKTHKSKNNSRKSKSKPKRKTRSKH
jgi:hypothetical protein